MFEVLFETSVASAEKSVWFLNINVVLYETIESIVTSSAAFAAIAVVLEAVAVSKASTLNKDALSAVCKLVITWFCTRITCLNSSIALLIEKRLELFEK
jgi:hypothetical protein